MNTNESRGYVLNGTTVLPLGSMAQPSRPRDAGKVRIRLRRRFLLLLAAPFVIGGLIMIATLSFLPSTRDVEVLPGSAVIGIDGEDVAVVVYDDSSRPGLFEPMFQMRVAAIRLSDGEQLWDRRLNEDLSGNAVVLSGDSSRVYVGSDHGLVILDARTGDVQAEGASIVGIGPEAVLAASAYGYDPATESVVALTATGTIVQIAVGAVEAVPADAAVTARWIATLNAGPVLDESSLTRHVDRAVSPDGTVFEIVPVSEAARRDALEITAIDANAVVRTELVDAEILPLTGVEARLGVLLETGQFLPGDFGDLTGDDLEALMGEAFEAMPSEEDVVAPAGLAQGVILVQHRESVNADRMLLSSIDIATGQIIDTVEMQTDAVRALTGPGGTTTVVAAAPESWWANVLLVLGGDGTFRSVDVGSVPWWLVPFG